MKWCATISVLCLAIAAPSLGQEARAPDELETLDSQGQPLRTSRIEPTTAGSNAQSSVGRTGQRQTREQVTPAAKPMTRISNRINNRVQSRIRTRIDPNYDPQANARSPFEAAESEARNEPQR